MTSARTNWEEATFDFEKKFYNQLNHIKKKSDEYERKMKALEAHQRYLQAEFGICNNFMAKDQQENESSFKEIVVDGPVQILDDYSRSQTVTEGDHLGKSSLHLNSTFEKILNIDIIKQEKNKKGNADLEALAPTLAYLPKTDHEKLKSSYQQRLDA